MKKPKWVLLDVVQAIHDLVLSEHGGETGIRDIALLESALARAPQKLAYDSQANIYDLAASYSFGISKNHPFVDGNKRSAFMAGVVFLEINGLKFIASESESTVIFEGLAAGAISEPELSHWFEQNTEDG